MAALKLFSFIKDLADLFENVFYISDAMNGIQPPLFFIEGQYMNCLCKVFGNALVEFFFFVIYAVFNQSSFGNPVSYFLFCYIQRDDKMDGGIICFHETVQCLSL